MIQNEMERSKAQEVALVSSMLDIRTYSAFQRLRDAKLLAMPQKGARGQEDTRRKSVLFYLQACVLIPFYSYSGLLRSISHGTFEFCLCLPYKSVCMCGSCKAYLNMRILSMLSLDMQQAQIWNFAEVHLRYMVAVYLYSFMFQNQGAQELEVFVESLRVHPGLSA